MRPEPKPLPRGVEPRLTPEQEEFQKGLRAQAKEVRQAARAEIKREVLDQLPKRATDHDKWLIQRDAFNILDNDFPQYKALSLRDREISPEFNEKAAKDDGRGGPSGPGGSGTGGGPTTPKDLPDPPPDGPAGGGKSAIRNAPEHSSPTQASVTQPSTQSKFISQTEQTPKRFSRSDVSIFASPKAEGPDKTRNAEITKDATPKPAERFDRQKESQFTSRVGKAPLNNDRPKVPGLGRDER